MFGCALLTSYLLLFIQFYITTYRKKPAGKKPVANGKANGVAGYVFVMAGLGRSAHRTLYTATKRNKHALDEGEKMSMLGWGRRRYVDTLKVQRHRAGHVGTRIRFIVFRSDTFYGMRMFIGTVGTNHTKRRLMICIALRGLGRRRGERFRRGSFHAPSGFCGDAAVVPDA